jgi:hypothetical protein
MTRNYIQQRAFILMVLVVAVAGLGCRTSEETVSVPAGTKMEVALQTPLSTETASEGQEFMATTTQPIVVEGKTVIETGTMVHGTVTKVVPPDAVSQEAELTLQFEEVMMADGESHSIDAEPIAMVAQSDAKSDVERVAGSTIAGAVVGGIIDGGHGAVIGGILGAGAGGVWAVTTKGDQIVLEPGQKFLVEISSATEVPIQAGM